MGQDERRLVEEAKERRQREVERWRANQSKLKRAKAMVWENVDPNCMTPSIVPQIAEGKTSTGKGQRER